MRRGRPPYPGPLTPREWEVLRLIEDGLTNEEIAARLGISFAGARYHVAEIISKLGVSSRYEAVAWAQERSATQRPWAGLVLLVSRLRLGSPVGVASVGVVVAGVAIIAAALLLLRSGGASDPTDSYESLAVSLDSSNAEAFIRGLPPLQYLEPGQVLYLRTETYERHGPKAPQIYAANGIPVERFVREMWIEAGPNDTWVRGYGRVLDEDGTPLLAYHTERGVSRIIDVPSGTLFRQDDVPDDLSVVGDPTAHIDRYLEALASGEVIVAGLSDSDLILESRHDEAYYERVFFSESRLGRDLTEEQKAEFRKSFFQRNQMENESSFNVPFYGDLNAVELIVRQHINSDGLYNKQETVIRNEAGEYILVGSSEADRAIVDAIPPEVIALTETR